MQDIVTKILVERKDLTLLVSKIIYWEILAVFLGRVVMDNQIGRDQEWQYYHQFSIIICSPH